MLELRQANQPEIISLATSRRSLLVSCGLSFKGKSTFPRTSNHGKSADSWNMTSRSRPGPVIGFPSASMSAVGHFQARDHVEQRRLAAAAARAHETDKLRLVHLQADPVQRQHRAAGSEKALRYFFDRELARSDDLQFLAGRSCLVPKHHGTSNPASMYRLSSSEIRRPCRRESPYRAMPAAPRW